MKIYILRDPNHVEPQNRRKIPWRHSKEMGAAAYSDSCFQDVAPDGAWKLFCRGFYKYAAPTALQKSSLQIVTAGQNTNSHLPTAQICNAPVDSIVLDDPSPCVDQGRTSR
ncbi:MAG: hypothetical protein HOP33_07100 [Verrucomicrobia bacterium]|nr:hypothetical protein [Verrucomicrobiota bacterium]